MITANVIHRVFQILAGEEIGTCFTIDHDNRQYIVTAKHVLKSWDGNSKIQLYYSEKWHSIDVSVIGMSNSADIAVLSTSFQLSPIFSMPATSKDLCYGQDVFFLGFPYGFSGDVGSLNRGFPMPLVKKAIVSCFHKENDAEVFLLDGHNNPGFSGGPVIFKPTNSPEFRVAAVISGYRYINHPIQAGDNDTPLTYQYNTGIIVSYSIGEATRLIEQNPIGLSLAV